MNFKNILSLLICLLISYNVLSQDSSSENKGVSIKDFIKTPKKLSKKELIERNLKKRIRMAFTSGGEEPVLDSGGGKHSVFAKSFLDVMKQISEPVEGRYIFNRVSEKLVLNANQQPQYNPILNSGGERNGDFYMPHARGLYTSTVATCRWLG